MKEAFRRIDKDIEIIQLPAERSLLNANLGFSDGEFVRIGNMDRTYRNLVPVPEKIIDLEFVAFSNNQDIKISGWGSLAPYHIGIVRGWKILEENITESASLARTKNQTLLFKMLARNRADIVVYSRFEGSALIEKLGLNNIKVLEPPLARREMFLYLNKKHIGLVVPLTKVLRDMKQEGLFEKFKSQASRQFLEGTDHD